MTRALFVFVGFLLLLSACTQRLACPAYQSSFIYDKDALRQKFSYFNEDSTPKILIASKSKYLIAVPESYRRKYRKMLTVEMKPVYPKKPDSLKNTGEFSLAEMDPADSIKLDSAALDQGVQPGDSTYAITKTKEKFNLDQDLYMWYFREMLVLPDVRAAMQDNSEKRKEAAKITTVKKEKIGFFKSLKNLFKKKQKTDSTVTIVEAPPKIKSTQVNEPAQPKKKRGLFKKKNKETPVEPPKKVEPKKADPKKEDGGFD